MKYQHLRISFVQFLTEKILPPKNSKSHANKNLFAEHREVRGAPMFFFTLVFMGDSGNYKSPPEKALRQYTRPLNIFSSGFGTRGGYHLPGGLLPVLGTLSKFTG